MVLKQSLQMLSTIFIIKRCQIVVNKQSAIEPDKIPLQVALDITCIEPLCAPLNHVNWLSNLYHNLFFFFSFFFDTNWKRFNYRRWPKNNLYAENPSNLSILLKYGYHESRTCMRGVLANIDDYYWFLEIIEIWERPSLCTKSMTYVNSNN